MIVLVLVTLGIGATPADDLPTIEVPFELVRNQIAFEVFVEGTGPYSVRLDSGIHPSSISNEVARLAGLEPGPVAGNVAGFGSERVGYRPVLVPKIAIGDLELADLDAVAVDIPYAKERFGVDGVLGQSFLSRVVTQIDYPEGKLRFYPRLGPKAEAGIVRHTVRLLSTGPAPRLDSLRVNGEPIRVALDTGASAALVLSDATVRKLGMEAERQVAEVKIAHGARGPFEARVGGSVRVGIGPFEVKDLPVSFAPDGYNQNLLGNEFLKHFRVTLDYGAQTMTLEQASRAE